MSTEWMKNIEKDLASVTKAEIEAMEPPEDCPEVESVVIGVLSDEIRRVLTLRRRYEKLGFSVDERLHDLINLGEGKSSQAKRLKGRLRLITLNLEILEGIFSASIYTAFPELIEKAGVLVVRGWKVVGFDAEITIRKRPPISSNN